MRSERERVRDSYPYNEQRVRANSRKKKNAGVSLGFCWGFGFVVCATFGLASFLMLSAGHFDSFSPGSGVNPAWGGGEHEENFTTTSLISVEVTELEHQKDFSDLEQYAMNTLEEFGPLPKYLSDYESITLTAMETGETMPKEDDEEEEPAPAAVSSPAQEPTPAVTVAEEPKLEEVVVLAWSEYIVKNGETLSDIAKAHGNITAQDILRANGLKDANRLSENQLLLIPNDSSKVDETLDEVKTRKMRLAAAKEKLEPVRVKKYVVAPGDSLWSIASSQNIELDTLIGSNAFRTSARLRPGATLRIPNQDGIFYTMKKGDTIEAVSKRYGVSMSKIRAVNAAVDVSSLKTGNEIFLPGARPEGLTEHNEPVKVAETPKKTAAKAPAKNEKREPGEVAVKSVGFRWPLMGRINSPVGWRTHPITRRKDFHTGIDIKGDRGVPIKAAGAGRVIYSGWMGGYGKVIVIEHNNGQSTLYAHCSTLLKGKGENVSSGALIAKVGTTGRSTGPHLHFEVRNGNSPVNPIKYLTK